MEDLEPSLMIIESGDIPIDDRVNAYVALDALLIQPENAILQTIVNNGLFSRFYNVLLRDIPSEQLQIKHASLRVLSHFVFHEKLIRCYTAVQSRNLLRILTTMAVTTSDKSTCHLCIYCLAVQNFNAVHLDSVLMQCIETLEYVLDPELEHRSSRIVLEGLEAVRKLFKIHPRAMSSESVSSRWLVAIYPLMFHNNAEIRKRAIDILDVLVRDQNLRYSVPDIVSIFVADQVMKGNALTLQSMASGVQESSNNEKITAARRAIHAWGIILLLLGPKYFNKSDIMNPLLRTPHNTFTDPSQAVRAETFNVWRTLVDVITRDGGVLSQSKTKLILAPYTKCLEKERIIIVRQACVTSWIASINKICEKMSLIDIYDSVVTPVLDVLLRDGDLNMRHDGFTVLFGLLTTDVEGGAVPSLPFRRGDESNMAKYLSLLEENAVSWCSAIERSIIHAVNANDSHLTSAIIKVWHALLRRIFGPTPFVTDGSLPVTSTMHAILRCCTKVVCPVHSLASVEDVKARSRWVSSIVSMSEDLLSQGSHHLGKIGHSLPRSFVEDRFGGKDTATPPYVYLSEAWVNAARPAMTVGEERLRGVFTRLIEGVIRGIKPLDGLNQVINALESRGDGSVTDNVPAALRFWTIIAKCLQEHVDITKEISRGQVRKSKSGDYQTLYAVLIFPVRRLITESYDDNVWVADADALPSWRSLFASFHQAVALKTGRALEDCVEGVCARLVAATEGSYLSSMPSAYWFLVECASTIVEQFDMAKATTLPKHLTKILVRLLDGGYEALMDKTLWNGLETQLQQRYIHLLRAVGSFFSAASTAMAIVDAFSHTLSKLLSIDDRMPVTALEGVVKELFDSIRRESGIQSAHFSSATPDYRPIFNNQCLQRLSTVLSATLRHRSSTLRSIGAHFWQDSFGLKPDDKHNKLVYSSELYTALLRFRGDLNLPDWIKSVDEALGMPAVIEPRPGTPPPTRPPFMMSSPLKVRSSPLKPKSSLRSPAKIQGNVLTPSRTPNRTPSRVTPKTKRRRLYDDDEASQPFIDIPSPPKKARILTQHQKESRHRADGVPPTYTALDQSMVPESISVSRTESGDAQGPTDFTGAAMAASEEATRIASKKKVHFDLHSKSMLSQSLELDSATVSSITTSTDPADKMLRQYVSGVGGKSFSQVLLARGIKTVADLARLPVDDAKTLPIPQPVRTLLKAFTEYASTPTLTSPRPRPSPAVSSPVVRPTNKPSWFTSDAATLARTMSTDELHTAQKEAMEVMAKLVEATQKKAMGQL